jgi:hypothetical protein
MDGETAARKPAITLEKTLLGIRASALNDYRTTVSESFVGRRLIRVKF